MFLDVLNFFGLFGIFAFFKNIFSIFFMDCFLKLLRVQLKVTERATEHKKWRSVAGCTFYFKE